MKNLKFAGLIVIILISAFVLSSFFTSLGKKDLRDKKPAPKETVKTISVKPFNYKYKINSYGRIYSFDKIEIYSEVTGILENTSVKFKDGNLFKQGDVLVKINSDVYENSLLAQKSNLLNQITLLLPDLKIDFPESYPNWLNYLKKFDLKKKLANLPEPLNDKEKFYISSKNIYKMYYDIKSMEETLDKYTITAPFDGIVTNSTVNPGTLIRTGQKIGEFIGNNLFELKAPIPSKEMKYVKIGSSATISSLDNSLQLEGKIVRISPSIDQSSQTVNVFIQLKNKSLIDGMFFNVVINGKNIENVSKIPQTAYKNGYVKALINNEKKNLKVKVIDETNDSYFVKGIDENSTIIVN